MKRSTARLAGAHEFRNAVGIEAVEVADGGFGDHDAGGVDAEIVAAVDQAGHAVHDECGSRARARMSKMMFQRSPSR